MDAAFPPRVPTGWKAEWDANYQEWYYVNLHTKRSQWEKPVVLPTTTELLERPVTLSRGGGRKPENLPNGWKAVWDSNYKEWFYANVHTKQTQWEKPTEPASLIPLRLSQNVDVDRNPTQPENSFGLNSLSLKEASRDAAVNKKQVRWEMSAEPAGTSRATFTKSATVNAKPALPDGPLVPFTASTEPEAARVQKPLNEIEWKRASSSKVYQTLHDADSFRMLELRPGSRGDPLSGSLVQPIQLDWQPKYDALSYRWSEIDWTDPKVIDVDGLPLPIGPDLYAALIQFRQAEVPRFLWIDQICINQNDEDEKIHQLKIMAEIYSKAWTVLIWLGPASDQSDIAMEFFPIFVDLVRRNEEIAKSQRASQAPSDVIERKGKLAAALYHLFERPWFGRVWTLQEAALGSTTELWCGTKSFPFQVLEEFQQGCDSDEYGHWASALGLIEPSFNTPDGEDPPGPKVAHIYVVSILKRGFTTPARILNSLRSLDCSQDQDRIYSVLRFFDPDLVREVTSRKERSIAELYHRVAVYGIRHGEFDHVGAAGLSQQRMSYATSGEPSIRPYLTLPSWVPDWTYKVQSHSFWVQNRDSMNKRNRPLFVAGGLFSHRNDWFFSSDDTVWNATGVIVDEVKDCASPFRILKIPEGPGDLQSSLDTVKTALKVFKSYITSCMKLAADCSPNYGSANIEQACRLSLVGGMMPEGSTTTMTGVLVRATNEAVNSLFDDFEKSVWMVNEGENMVELVRHALADETYELTDEDKARLLKLASVQDHIGEYSKRNNLFNSMAEACKGRRFFVTGGKSYMGIAPDITQPGDKVCVLPGCCAPLVIRPKGTRYQLIGECFVAGIMDGEIMNDPHWSLQEIAFE